MANHQPDQPHEPASREPSPSSPRVPPLPAFGSSKMQRPIQRPGNPAVNKTSRQRRAWDNDPALTDPHAFSSSTDDLDPEAMSEWAMRQADDDEEIAHGKMVPGTPPPHRPEDISQPSRRSSKPAEPSSDRPVIPPPPTRKAYQPNPEAVRPLPPVAPPLPHDRDTRPATTSNGDPQPGTSAPPPPSPRPQTFDTLEAKNAKKTDTVARSAPDEHADHNTSADHTSADHEHPTTTKEEAVAQTALTMPARDKDTRKAHSTTGSDTQSQTDVSHPWDISADELVTRIPATELFPVIENGLLPAKAVEGESIPIRATVFREGHDAYAAEAVLLDPDGQVVQRARMKEVLVGLDRCEGWVKPTHTGMWSFRVDTWSDPYETWSHAASVKVAAGVDVELMLEEGARLMERAAKGDALHNVDQQAPTKAAQSALRDAAKVLRDSSKSAQTRLSAGLHARIRQIFREAPLRDLLDSTRSYPLQVDRERALYGSWYEIFPRSHGAQQKEDGTWQSGTLKTAADSLPRIARMGFDVVYLTPIHPIGTTFRKGKNNTLTACEGDPGSPYGIGGPQGGHDEIHPELGTFDDFDDFVTQAKGLGLEVALDVALQCSPDHPWVSQHPDWFTQRADGTIAYAENPPKKYQDIYPLNFDNDPEGIYQAIWDVIEKWISHGVTIFRVDNPHTKPVQFWQRFLKEMHAKHPDVLFLAEAFTRPAMMRTLGAVGFHQSYTYFAWRNDKEELEEYFEEVARETAHLMRPTFWPTTHDILTEIMVRGGFAAHVSRAVLAATGSPSWGIYSGYELIENVQRPGFEEGIDNEKYEFKPRDFTCQTALVMSTLFTRLNSARRKHPALQRLRNITIHQTNNDSIICYSRHLDAWESPTGSADTVIVVVNLDPQNFQSGHVFLDTTKLGLNWAVGGGGPFMRVRDELDGHDYSWGEINYVEFAPYGRMAHVFAVEPL